MKPQRPDLDPEAGRAIEKVVFLVVALLLVLSFSPRSHADVISELGAGVKLEASTSYILMPVCEQVTVVAPEWPANPRPGGTFSCGGDNPAFIGWPIAWEREYQNGAIRFRGGWFHYSNWFDGGRDRETHMDLAAATVTFNWSQWVRNRRSK